LRERTVAREAVEDKTTLAFASLRVGPGGASSNGLFVVNADGSGSVS
jgi:hypothetical protein